MRGTYKEWAGGRGEVSSEGRWAARGRLKPPLELFRPTMSKRSASHGPKTHSEGLRDILLLYWGEFQTQTFHVVPSMGPIVSNVNLHG